MGNKLLRSFCASGYCSCDVETTKVKILENLLELKNECDGVLDVAKIYERKDLLLYVSGTKEPDADIIEAIIKGTRAPISITLHYLNRFIFILQFELGSGAMDIWILYEIKNLGAFLDDEEEWKNAELPFN